MIVLDVSLARFWNLGGPIRSVLHDDAVDRLPVGWSWCLDPGGRARGRHSAVRILLFHRDDDERESSKYHSSGDVISRQNPTKSDFGYEFTVR